MKSDCDWSVSTGVNWVLVESGVVPNTAVHSRENSSSPVDGAFRISFSKVMSSFSRSSGSRSSERRSLLAESRKGMN